MKTDIKFEGDAALHKCYCATQHGKGGLDDELFRPVSGGEFLDEICHGLHADVCGRGGGDLSPYSAHVPGTDDGARSDGNGVEKATAFATATEHAAVAAATGADPAKIAHAALRPYRAKTQSNVRKYRR